MNNVWWMNNLLNDIVGVIYSPIIVICSLYYYFYFDINNLCVHWIINKNKFICFTLKLHSQNIYFIYKNVFIHFFSKNSKLDILRRSRFSERFASLCFRNFIEIPSFLLRSLCWIFALYYILPKIFITKFFIYNLYNISL